MWYTSSSSSYLYEMVIITLGCVLHAFNFKILVSISFLDGNLGDLEKRTCQVLCRLRDGDEDKEVSSTMKLVTRTD